MNDGDGKLFNFRRQAKINSLVGLGMSSIQAGFML